MKRANKMLAFVLAAAMLLSNVAYAAPGENGENPDTEASVNTLSLDPKEETGGETSTEAEEPVLEETQETGEKQTEVAPVGNTEAVSETEEDAKEETTAVDETKGQTEEQDENQAGTVVTYDITFESQEKQGIVLDMNDKEVKEGEILKTDENGKAKFKVKANSGYEVEKVVNKAENIPLTLVGNSYYEVQVSSNTVIEIHYKKIPENKDSEEAEDNGDAYNEKKEDTDRKTASENSSSKDKMVRIQNLQNTEYIAVTAKFDDGSPEKPISILSGKVDENSYTFSGATACARFKLNSLLNAGVPVAESAYPFTV